jgi:hypothetical protein
MSSEEMFEQICGSYLNLSRTRFQESLVVHVFAGPFASAIPSNETLVKLALYYDTIVISHPFDLLCPAVRFLRKQGYEQEHDALKKKCIQIREWIDGEVVKLLKIDSKDALEILDKTIERDYSDEDFRKFRHRLGPLFGYSPVAPYIRSKWVKIGGSFEQAMGQILVEGALYYTNRAILCSVVSGGTPLCTGGVGNDYLRYKFERIGSLNHRMKIPAILNCVLNITVPYADSLSVGEILSLRRKRKNSFARFRSRLNDLAIRIKSTPWDSEFQTEVKEIVKQEVLPELREVRRQMREIQPNLKSTSLKALVSQIPYIGFFGDLSEVMQTWRLEKRLEKNSLYFLAQL